MILRLKAIGGKRGFVTLKCIQPCLACNDHCLATQRRCLATIETMDSRRLAGEARPLPAGANSLASEASPLPRQTNSLTSEANLLRPEVSLLPVEASLLRSSGDLLPLIWSLPGLTDRAFSRVHRLVTERNNGRTISLETRPLTAMTVRRTLGLSQHRAQRNVERKAGKYMTPN